MKKLLLIASIIGLSFGQAYAADAVKPFYLGAGYQITDVNYNNGSTQISNGSFSYDRGDYFKNNFNNFNIFAGYQAAKNVALEVGYFQKNGQSKSNGSTGLIWSDNSHALTTTSQSDLRVINLDAIGNLALDSQEKFKVLGIIGVSHVSYKYAISYLDNGSTRAGESGSDNGFGLNLGVGFEAEVIKDIALRATAKYTQVSGIDFFDNFMTYTVGAKFSF